MNRTLLAGLLLALATAPARAQAPGAAPAAGQPPGPESALDGIYRLESINGNPLPVATRSSYGTIRGATMAIRRGRYAVVYVYGATNDRLRIAGSLSYRQGARQVEFVPATSDASRATAEYAQQAFTFRLANTFGFTQAELIFRYARPLPASTVVAGSDDAQPNQAQTVQPVQAQAVQPHRAQTIQPYQAQTVQPYQAQTVQPYQSRTMQPTQSEAPGRGSSGAPGAPLAAADGAAANACAAGHGGNAVEPLSNGLDLSWTLNQIKDRFGPGQSGWDRRTVTYPGFRVAAGGAEDRIWHLHITAAGICLNSGIGIGASSDDVRRVFGSAHGTTYDQYKLTFDYTNGRLSDIAVDPVSEFRPVRAGRAGTAQGAPTEAAGTRAQHAPASATSIVGTWYGSNVAAQIEIKANGTYTSGTGGAGRWSQQGTEIRFTGPLSGWNGGRATLDKGNIEFYWKNADGSTNYFALIRG